jgi:hypothetical protein
MSRGAKILFCILMSTMIVEQGHGMLRAFIRMARVCPLRRKQADWKAVWGAIIKRHSSMELHGEKIEAFRRWAEGKFPRSTWLLQQYFDDKELYGKMIADLDYSLAKKSQGWIDPAGIARETISFAIMSGDQEWFDSCLVEHPKAVRGMSGVFSMPPLVLAAGLGEDLMVKKLLDAGADPEEEDSFGRSYNSFFLGKHHLDGCDEDAGDYVERKVQELLLQYGYVPVLDESKALEEFLREHVASDRSED